MKPIEERPTPEAKPTPYTDARTFYMNDDNFTPVVHKLTAQTLERQRDEAREQCDRNAQMLTRTLIERDGFLAALEGKQ